MRHILNRLYRHLYTVSILLVITLVALMAITDNFATLRQNITAFRTRLREDSAELMGQVWCTTSFTGPGWQTILGHYPGMSAEEVVKFHADAVWMLRSDSVERETRCYRSWQAAYGAAAVPAAGAEPATEEEYENAVLSLYLGGETAPAATVTAVVVTTAEPVAAAMQGLCYSEIKTRNNLIVTVPHPPGGRQAIETVLNAREDRAELTEYLVRATICFDTLAEAADYITGGEVVLAEDATEADYHAAMETWQAGKR